MSDNRGEVEVGFELTAPARGEAEGAFRKKITTRKERKKKK